MKTVSVLVSMDMADFIVNFNKNYFGHIDAIPSLQFICLVWHGYEHIFRILKLNIFYFFSLYISRFSFRIESNRQAIRKYYQSKYIYINFPFDSIKKKLCIPCSIQFSMSFLFCSIFKMPLHLA